MKLLRRLLFPFSILYWAVTTFRNYLYDKGWKKATSFNIPVIGVGNLSVGGTGKTPMVEYLIKLFSHRYRTATLSRGYKRKSQGFVLADTGTTVEQIGDEPFQYHSKYKNIRVAVDADRAEGVRMLLHETNDLQLVILDDAFQHRKIKAGFYILLTAYGDPFYEDMLLPSGNLRESASGVHRADIVIVTKCPTDLSEKEQQTIKKRIDKPANRIFFSAIEYAPYVTNGKEELSEKQLGNSFIAVAGIAKPEYFYRYLNRSAEDTVTFPDHHHFSDADVQKILKLAAGRKIVTTEKDYMRLQALVPTNVLYYLPIEMKLLVDHELFENAVDAFVTSRVKV